MMWSCSTWGQPNNRRHLQFTAQVYNILELCWDKCVEKPGNRLDSPTENCLSSCVDCFIDTSITN
ncbi:unnamed protein product [Gulo gulo]|uniref:Mitochondrial import inner membrane translocase subunit n=1 Tax=Gulo gulo TaxID=48420 RepID=A0A9X9PZZ5_GULGU|nr:unnamed protein product [Gulo gulo]